MKQILIITLVCMFYSCVDNSVEKPVKVISNDSLKDSHLMNEISHGLHLITINDTTQILIYRGTESCTMIKL